MIDACDSCLRRAFLVAHLAPRIAGLLDHPAPRIAGLLALPDEAFVAAAAGATVGSGSVANGEPREAPDHDVLAQFSDLRFH